MQISIIPTEDEDISKEMQKSTEKKGVTFVTSAKVLPETPVKQMISVTISAEVNGETKEFTAEKMLVSVGRQANVEGIGIDNTEIEVENGFIETMTLPNERITYLCNR